MITLYTGTPGSGKSLHSAKDILFSLKIGKDVICNFPIKEQKKKMKGKFTYVSNNNLTVPFLRAYAKENHKPFKEHETLLVIDECSVMFNCREFSRSDRMEWITFLQHHRKLGYDLILITQQDKMIDKQIRGFIETEIKHRNVRSYKFLGWLLSIVFGGMFVAVEYWYQTRLKCESSFFLYRKKYGQLYDTYAIFE